MTSKPSPFKFLDSYDQQDEEIFFGREEETRQLYDALSGVKHLLVYGPSGAGKTSLIECGLRNQFSDADWFALSIRRGNNLIASTFARINEALEEPFSLDQGTGLPVNPEVDLGMAIDRLFSERFQPVYLLFDQFEELLISGTTEEKTDFFKRLDKLIRYKVPYRVILIMQEEFIGHLSEYEEDCPAIFKHRFRLEKMTRSKVEQVIAATLKAEYYQPYFQVVEPEQLASYILTTLPDHRQKIDLSHVQAFLNELWNRAIERARMTDKPILEQALLRDGDKLEEVLETFLNKQLAELALKHEEELPLEVLAVMISEQHTKLQIDKASLRRELERREVILPDSLKPLLHDLKRRRIIRYDEAQELYEIAHDSLAHHLAERHSNQNMPLLERPISNMNTKKTIMNNLKENPEGQTLVTLKKGASLEYPSKNIARGIYYLLGIFIVVFGICLFPASIYLTSVLEVKFLLNDGSITDEAGPFFSLINWFGTISLVLVTSGIVWIIFLMQISYKEKQELDNKIHEKRKEQSRINSRLMDIFLNYQYVKKEDYDDFRAQVIELIRHLNNLPLSMFEEILPKDTETQTPTNLDTYKKSLNKMHSMSKELQKLLQERDKIYSMDEKQLSELRDILSQNLHT